MGAMKADSTIAIEKGLSNIAFARGFAALPPSICGLALGINGMGTCLATWARIQGVDITPQLLLLFPLLAGVLLFAYGTKIVVAPSAFWRDVAEPTSLPPLNGASATAQGLAVRFSALLPVAATQGVIIMCHACSICIGIRFAQLNWKKRAWPDPSWFPGFFLCGMTNLTVQSV